MLKSMKRAVHFDFHTNGGITDFGKDFDPVKFAARLKDSNVGYINFFCQCNMGFSYYPTDIGIRYPYMQGDLFGSVLRECKKVGVGVSAYVNIGLNHEQSVRHPEWLKMNKEGQIYDFSQGKNWFRRMCHNTGDHDYILSVIKEIVDKYDPDAELSSYTDIFVPLDYDRASGLFSLQSDWWYSSTGWVAENDVWSVLIEVSDESGNKYFYYFRMIFAEDTEA